VLDPSGWTNCYGEHDTSGFAGSLENAMGIGFTFGGQNFFGHGVYLSRGSATFKINSISCVKNLHLARIRRQRHSAILCVSSLALMAVSISVRELIGRRL